MAMAMPELGRRLGVPAILFPARQVRPGYGHPNCRPVRAGTLISCAFSRTSFFGRAVFLAVVMSILLLPSQVYLTSQYQIVQGFGWLDTRTRLVAPRLVSALCPVTVRSGFVNLPAKLEKAALLISIAPILIMVTVLQRWVIDRLASSGPKYIDLKETRPEPSSLWVSVGEQVDVQAHRLARPVLSRDRYPAARQGDPIACHLQLQFLPVPVHVTNPDFGERRRQIWCDHQGIRFCFDPDEGLEEAGRRQSALRKRHGCSNLGAVGAAVDRALTPEKRAATAQVVRIVPSIQDGRHATGENLRSHDRP